MKNRESQTLFRRATKVMVGGVNSPVRAFKAVGGTPLFISKGQGARVWDADGNEYTDMVCSWGAIILGHADKDVVKASCSAVNNGSSFGAPTRTELELAEKISELVKSAEVVRLVNSGTEAVMTSLRLARGYTGRKLLVKFEGNYHGHSDIVLSKAGSGLATLGIPSSAGVPEGCVADTVTLPYNDINEFESFMERKGKNVAAVIVEPVAGNMGVVPADREFLLSIRKKCDDYSCVLIFDEVISGFRVSIGGAQGLYGVYPDLTVLGKIIGGGFPIGAVTGKRVIMKALAPEGPVYQAGTLAGNPVAAAAGLATLSKINQSTYIELENYGQKLENLVKAAAKRNGISITLNRAGSMLSVFFAQGPIKNFSDVIKSRTKLYTSFFWSLIDNGVYTPPSPYESLFFTVSHDGSDLKRLNDAIKISFEALNDEKHIH